MRNMLGCLSMIPNAFIGAIVANRAAKLLYAMLYAGIPAAISGRAMLLFPDRGSAHLSNGLPLNTIAWGAMWVFVQLPVFALVIIGLTHLAENLGEVMEKRGS
jgi:hypothetical protein